MKSFLHTTNLFIRSCIFSILMMTITFLLSFICILIWPLPLKFRYYVITHYMSLNLWLLKVICRIQYKVEGLENIPKDKSGIVFSKHQSAWETFFIPTVFRYPAIILKRELFWVPFFGWGLATINPIAINRNNRASAMEQIIKKGSKCLEEGRWILVFPEGTRIPVGKVGNYRIGGARLASATGYPLVPVAHNAGYFWPRRKFIKKPGTVHVVIGKPIEPKDRTAEEILEEAKNWIESTVIKIGGPRHPL